MNETHDPSLTSWIENANDSGCDFPIQNLPFGVFRSAGSAESPRVGVAIGDRIVDIGACRRSGLFSGAADDAAKACESSSLNLLMALGSAASSALRARFSQILRSGFKDARLVESALVPMSDAEMFVPAQIGDFTDFYASVYHATNVGSMFRPDNPLLPNYKWVPIAYHGRSSSIVMSGTTVARPVGQMKDDAAASPTFGPSRMLDYELEVGFYVGRGNMIGSPVSIDRAEEHIFGLCLVNDWSARDIQKWEYQPLGPFLAKNFATTVSPWVVTLEALEPFRVPAFTRAADDPAPMAYLFSEKNQARGGIDISLEVSLLTRQMGEKKMAPFRISKGNFSDIYWTIAQMLAHHTSNGCNLRPGDLIASGTVSGSAKESRGCLLEYTWRGKEPIKLPTGEERKFLHGGDEVIIRGYCESDTATRIGFGECRGEINAGSGG